MGRGDWVSSTAKAAGIEPQGVSRDKPS